MEVTLEFLFGARTKLATTCPSVLARSGRREVTRYSCAEAKTRIILEKIIQETTNRLNRLSQAESENEAPNFAL